MKSFWALRIYNEGQLTVAKHEKLSLNDLTGGGVTIAVKYSGINYKDALAVTGRGKILKSHPLIAGVDGAGTIISSTDSRYAPGQNVLVTGCGTGEVLDGGFSEVLRTSAESVVPLPDGLSLKESMVLGTAGFTAALALTRMEQNGQHPEMGPILITGASGGVGSFAVQIFTNAGYEVHAVSGKPLAHARLKELGASKVVIPTDLKLGDRALEKARYGGAVDNVGGELLSKILAHIQLWGNVASIGLADSPTLNTTVKPFILRGVSLLGTSSNNCELKLRYELWKKLASEWRPKVIEGLIAETVGLKDIPHASERLLNREINGRILVEVQQ